MVRFVTCYNSAVRNATPSPTSDFPNKTIAKGIHLSIDVTVISGTGFTVTIEGKDALSQKYYTLLVSATITTTGLAVLKVFPGATPTANLVANDTMPPIWRVKTTHSDGSNITYSIGASYVNSF